MFSKLRQKRLCLRSGGVVQGPSDKPSQLRLRGTQGKGLIELEHMTLQYSQHGGDLFAPYVIRFLLKGVFRTSDFPLTSPREFFKGQILHGSILEKIWYNDVG